MEEYPVLRISIDVIQTDQPIGWSGLRLPFAVEIHIIAQCSGEKVNVPTARAVVCVFLVICKGIGIVARNGLIIGEGIACVEVGAVDHGELRLI